MSNILFLIHAPINIQVKSDELDKRIGFFGYVVLNVSWDRPKSNKLLNNIFH